MQTAYFFGYGSLVNRHTHIYAPAHHATVQGWRRAWRVAADRQVAFLTVIRDEDCAIDGLIAPVPDGDWAALDLRETGYDRMPLTVGLSHEAADAGEIAVYHIPADKHGPADGVRPILLSYLDVVVEGYLQVFGAEGGRHFFDTTAGWDGPILNDRAAPRYPRAQLLTEAETAVVDAELGKLGVEVVAA